MEGQAMSNEFDWGSREYSPSEIDALRAVPQQSSAKDALLDSSTALMLAVADTLAQRDAEIAELRAENAQAILRREEWYGRMRAAFAPIASDAAIRSIGS
jgi:hypothetical protein